MAKHKPKEYLLKELLQDSDFNDQADADHYYETHKIMPYIDFQLNKEHHISKINIVFQNENDFHIEDLKYSKYELLTSYFWEKLEICPRFKVFPYERFSSNIKRRQIKTGNHSLKIYDNCFVFSSFSNIWNGYCLHEGKTTITRDSFLLWLYRLYAVIHDLFSYPYTQDTDWNKRTKLLLNMIQDKNSSHLEYFRENSWTDLRNTKYFTANQAHNSRILDAHSLLNDFYHNVKPDSPLEEFLISCYKSFGDKLCKEQLALKCDFCNTYISYKKGKKHCSYISEGIDCGKKARNKRHYKKHREQILPKAIKSAVEYRKYCKEN